MLPEDPSGFTFVDKRHATEGTDSNRVQDAPPLPPPTEVHTSADPLPDSMNPDDIPQGMPRLSIRDRLLMCVDILYQGAWIAMGLVPDPATGEIKADLPQAKLAIDGAAFLAKQSEATLDEETTRELRRVISDLQMNYVRQVNR